MASTPHIATAGPPDEVHNTHDQTAQSAIVGASVAISGVTVTYDSQGESGHVVGAVNNATLDIPAGSILALLGPSGCGKTSLLRAIAGLERPKSGTITIGRHEVSGDNTWVHPERRNVGMVFQDGALFPHLTVAANVAFGLHNSSLKMNRSERSTRVGEMLELVDLADFGDRYPGTLSGGQQQRVALARSLAPQPSVLLLDEPFSALDAALRVQVRAEVARIVRDISVTTVFVTHDQDEAFVLGDQVAVLRDGHIEQVGTPEELYQHPSTRWIAGFVGEANLVRGQLDTAGVAAGFADTLLGPVPIASPLAIGPDQNIEVLVRPEQVELVSGDCAVVTNIEYYGHDVRYELQLNDGSVLAARSKSGELHERGTQVCVRFNG
ncbi:MAG: ABC transporter ATP-binding protein, partial [Actinobacteria bacterium]